MLHHIIIRNEGEYIADYVVLADDIVTALDKLYRRFPRYAEMEATWGTIDGSDELVEIAFRSGCFI